MSKKQQNNTKYIIIKYGMKNLCNVQSIQENMFENASLMPLSCLEDIGHNFCHNS